MERLVQGVDFINIFPEAIIVIDADQRIRVFNRGAEHIFGYAAAEVIGKPLEQLIPTRFARRHRQQVRQFYQSSTTSRRIGECQEVSGLRKNGSEFPAEATIARSAADGEATMMVILRDISERKQAEAAILTHNRQQAAIADLSQRALAGYELPHLMDEAAALVAQTLSVEFAEILELLPEKNAFILKAGFGWKPGYVGHYWIKADAQTQPGALLASGEPMTYEDLPSEARFSPSLLLIEHGADSGASVIIQGSTRPFGTLGAHTARRHTFTQDDINLLQSIANVLSLAIERKQAETYIQEREASLRFIVDQTPAVIWSMDEELNITSSFGSGLTRLNQQPGEHAGRRFIEEQFIAPGTSEISSDAHRQALQGRTVTYEVNWAGRTYEAHIEPLRNPSGEITGVIGAAIDISEHKQLDSERTRRLEAERRARRAAETLREATIALTATLDLRRVLDEILIQLENIVPYDRACVFLQEAGNLHVAAARGYPDPQKVLGADYALSKDTTYKTIIHTARPLVLADIQMNARFRHWLGADDVRAWMGVPLLVHGQALGSLMLDGYKPGAFSAVDASLAQAFANQAAAAIENARLFEQVRLGREQLRQLTRQVVVTEEAERRRVSRELHDEAGQDLTALKISLELIRADLPPEATALQERLKEAADLARETMEKIRLLAHNLRPPELDAVGLDPVLEDLCQEFAHRTQIAIDYRGTSLPDLPDEITIAFYRILQEALTNVAKHANADKIWVALDYDADYIRLSVRDNGRGFNESHVLSHPSHSGIGLVGMRERLELLGGRLEIETLPGQSTRLVAYIPRKEMP
jgi:PAS domain S-box-containing protein